MFKKVIKEQLLKILNRLAEYLNMTLIDRSGQAIVNGYNKQGYFESIANLKPLDKELKPIPWFTYPAVEYISQLDLTGKRVFEWGSGNSSRFFSSRCKEIISIESDKGWYELVKSNLKTNQQIFYCEESEIPQEIDKYGKFDIIIIDSFHRFDCGLKALSHLEDHGLIILDNSDWYPETSQLLRTQGGLIEVDMHGFGPINRYSWTTSFYFSRGFDFVPVNGRQPQYSKNAIQQVGPDDRSLNHT